MTVAPVKTSGTLQGPKSLDKELFGDYLVRNHRPSKPLYAQEVVWSRNCNQPN